MAHFDLKQFTIRTESPTDLAYKAAQVFDSIFDGNQILTNRSEVYGSEQIHKLH